MSENTCRRSEALRLPFLLNLVEDVEAAVHGEAVREAEALLNTYDPMTQTSTATIYAGSSKTYSSTYTLNWGGSKDHDDSKVSDT